MSPLEFEITRFDCISTELHSVRGLDTHDIFSAILTRETAFVTFCLFFEQQADTKKGSALKRKNLLRGEAFCFCFPFGVNIFFVCLFIVL